MKHDIFDRPEFLVEANRQKKSAPPLAVELLVFLLVFVVLSILEGIIISVPMVAWMLTGERLQLLTQQLLSGNIDGYMDTVFELVDQLPEWITAVMLLSNAVLAAGAVLYCRWFEKRKPYTLGFVKKGAPADYALGALLGIVLFAAAYGLTLLLDGVRLTGVTIETKLLPMLLLILLGFLIQGAAEELLFRGYLMTSLSSRYSLPVCLAVSSVAFGLMHSGNVGFSMTAFLNIVLFGVFIGIYMLKTGSIWGACALHSFWNFTQGNILGLPVSGIHAGSSIFGSELIGSSEVLNGGDFGLEASLSVTVVLVVAIGIVCAVKGRRIAVKNDGIIPPEEG